MGWFFVHMFGIRWFDSAIQRDIFEYVFYLFVISEFVILFLSHKNSKGEKEKSDRGSRFAIIFGIFATIFFSCVPFGHSLPAFFYYIGTALLLIGGALRCWAVWTLRNFFTLSVQTKGEQKLIRNGPYRVIRHPAYTASIMQVVGFPLGVRSWPGLVFAVVIAALVYGYRIHTEEKALREHFGAEYEEYSKKTWRLFPFVF